MDEHLREGHRTISAVTTYRVEGELAELLKRAAERDVWLRIETDAGSFDLPVMDADMSERIRAANEAFERREGIWEAYDPERVIAALEAAVGVLEGVDVEELVRQIREDRFDER